MLALTFTSRCVNWKRFVLEPVDLVRVVHARLGHPGRTPARTARRKEFEGTLVKALTYHGRRDVRVEDVPDPRIEQPTDAIIQVTSSAICGSDLHLYEVLGPFLKAGDILGHEPMGIVQEVGAAVSHIKPGDRVVIPFNISCGSCWMCARGFFAQCETTQNRETGKGASLFGYTELYGSVPGGQAEFLRVPQAHFGPIKIPEEQTDERFLFLSDILPTAWQAVKYADLPADGTWQFSGWAGGTVLRQNRTPSGGGRGHLVDSVSERLEMARRHGIEMIDSTEVDDVAEMLMEMTGGRGPDSVIDAVGMEAHDSPAGKRAHAGGRRAARRVAKPLADKMAIDRMGALSHGGQVRTTGRDGLGQRCVRRGGRTPCR